MKKILIVFGLLSTPAFSAEEISLQGDASLEQFGESLDEFATSVFSVSLVDADFDPELEEAPRGNFIQNKQMAYELLQALLADPANANSNIRVSVGGSIAEYIVPAFTPRRDTMGQKEIIKSPSWAKDVSDIVKAATGGISGKATVKVNVQRKTPDGAETNVVVEITIEKK